MFERLAGEDFAYLTTTGRKSGRPHRIEMWFAIENGVLYMLSGGGNSADWVQNIKKDGAVRIQVGTRSASAKARIVRAAREDQRARELLDEKYMGWKSGKKLSSWARGSTPVAVDLDAH
jgi:deazaflavin-dependent oxidoreductase (nitroreductase family)